MIVRTRDSLLTTSSGYTNYRGILNLVIILLVLSNARAALENIIKYGILVDPLSWFQFLREGQKHWPALLIILSQALHIVIALAIEKLIATRLWSSPSPEEQNSKSTTRSNTKQQPLSSGSTGQQGLCLVARVSLLANLAACIALPPLVIYTYNTHPISTSVALMFVSIVFLKLVSYHMMCFWCRDSKLPARLRARTTQAFLRSYMPPALEFEPMGDDAIRQQQERTKSKLTPPSSPKQISDSRHRNVKSSDSNNNNNNNNNNKNSNDNEPSKTDSPPVVDKELTRKAALEALAKYPDNVGLRDMCAFISFPTLCYELDFPRTLRIRKHFLAKRIVELVILGQLDIALVQQWIVPTVSNSVIPFREMQVSIMLERLLKLAIPNHVIWLIWFYLFFHSLLNIAAELTRFADREFYRDWWNSESVSYFWSNWNLPVHKWCARHLYVPLISLGLSKCQASTAVFLVSAFFHEYLVSVPLKLFRMWAFTGMLIQLPWARFVSSYFNNHFANVAVWVSLIIGQPLCILMYYHDYYVINNIKSLPF